MKISGAFLIMMIVLFSCKKEDQGSYYGDYFWIYTYGYPRMEFFEAAEGISEKWKIKYHAVSGCMIDQKMRNTVDAKNKKTYAAIENKLGKSWREKYNRDIDHFMMKKVDVMDVLITNKLFREELKKHYIEIDNVDKDVFELSDEGDFRVIVYNNDLKYENKECLRLAVNTKNRTVNLIQ
ncbi:hypothetical protein ACM46_12120 [Chryseobacterium angstadtii]|uniref:Lipoprotein n=1 Tax=Chryseobacterium angstadtii TaxID=558151 RepID=A0A0J7IG05_9FLAO|nr:hypothetical protein [Chryseobacterium angstadtii]KMQ64944.1 hypothetical protein ACM46_12120 [Chryseobacterium angstadtii]